MKKLLLAALLAAFSVCASAQKTNHALGIHFGGSTADIEYQYHFSKQNFLDVTVGLFDLDKGFVAQGLYNWNIKQWTDWTPKFATWKFWGGFGAGIGYFDNDGGDDCLMLGPVGTLGFGFTLKAIPLTFGIDYRPMVAFTLCDDFDIEDTGFKNLGVTLTYRF